MDPLIGPDAKHIEIVILPLTLAQEFPACPNNRS